MIDSTRVINALKESPLSNTIIAAGSGICMYSISKYKRGLAIPNGVNLKKLASFFNVPDAQPAHKQELTSMDYVEIIRKKDAQIE